MTDLGLGLMSSGHGPTIFFLSLFFAKIGLSLSDSRLDTTTIDESNNSTQPTPTHEVLRPAANRRKKSKLDWIDEPFSWNPVIHFPWLAPDYSQKSLCNVLQKLDAAINSDNQLYLISDQNYWLLDFTQNFLDGPYDVSSLWPEVVNEVDAGCEIGSWHFIVSGTSAFLYSKSDNASLIWNNTIENWPNIRPDLYRILYRPVKRPGEPRSVCLMCTPLNQTFADFPVYRIFFAGPRTKMFIFDVYMDGKQLVRLNSYAKDNELTIERTKVGRVAVCELFKNENRILWGGVSKMSISQSMWPTPIHMTDYFNCDERHMMYVAFVSFYSLCLCAIGTLLFIIFNVIRHPWSYPASHSSKKNS